MNGFSHQTSDVGDDWGIKIWASAWCREVGEEFLSEFLGISSKRPWKWYKERLSINMELRWQNFDQNPSHSFTSTSTWSLIFCLKRTRKKQKNSNIRRLNEIPQFVPSRGNNDEIFIQDSQKIPIKPSNRSWSFPQFIETSILRESSKFVHSTTTALIKKIHRRPVAVP